MKKRLLFLVVVIGFGMATGYSQVEERSLSFYQNQTGQASSDVNFGHMETVLDAADMEKTGQLIRLRYDKLSGIIRLDDTKLIEDDAPATGVPEGYENYRPGPVEWVEDLQKEVVIKKILEVDNPSAVAARIVFKAIEVQGNRESLHLSVNGEKFTRPATQFAFPHARQYIDLGSDRWFYVELPVEKLRKGSNELLMWTESDTVSWRILIAHEKEFKRGSLTRRSPNHSMRSSDGGKSWSDSQLGPNGLIDGEYSIRLSLDQYLTTGAYVSPLIDLVNGKDPVKGTISNLHASFQEDVLAPSKTNVNIFIRHGSSPFRADESWTDWMPLESGRKYSLSGKRYLQWRAELSTENPLVSPLIRGFRITSEWEDHSINSAAGIKAHVYNNGEIIPASYPFAYENLNHEGLKEFREAHHLDEIVKGAETEFEVMMRLLNWAYRVPLTLDKYSWDWSDVTATPVIGEGSGMPKLNGPFEGRRMVGMCLYPNQALIGALLSMGYQARHINMHSEGMSGHEITEVWSNEFGKWIYLDATRDYYYFDLNTGLPLNLLEIHNLLAAQMPHVETWERPFVTDIGKEVMSGVKVGMRQGNNPFPVEDGGGSYLLKSMGHFRIIPRNDFLSNPLPVPVHTGMTMWGWDGFLNWYDDVFPKRDEYQNYSNRAADFYPALNQAKVILHEADEPGVVNVLVEEYTPGGFDSFLVRVNDGEWFAENDSSWHWSLQSGMNNIKVRTRNVRGVLGPVSHIGVTYNP